MAVSSNFKTSNDKVLYNITVTESNVNTANNTSDITVQVKFWRTNTGYETYGNGTVYCTIDGTQYSQAVTSSQKITNSGIILFNKRVTIDHDSTGAKTVNIKAKINIPSVVTSDYQGFNVTLTKISVAANAPTSVVIPSTVAIGDTITIKWSGASGTITGYEIQWAKGYTNNPTNWTSWKKVNSTATSGSTTDTYSNTSGAVNGSGMYVKYRVRTLNGSIASGWKESNAMRITGGMDINVNGSWKQGSGWINVNGTWKRIKHVFIKVNGVWKESL